MLTADCKCTCFSTASGWDETKCAYHGKPTKPFIRFRMLIGSNTHMCPKRGQFVKGMATIVVRQVATKRA